MSTSQTTAAPGVQLAEGTWHVDPKASELGFTSRGMFGVVTVRGAFKKFHGELVVDGAGARGALKIEAATLDTGHAKRDTHLRSTDFFEVEAHPTVTFALDALATGEDGAPVLSGVLRIRDNELPVTAPVQVIPVSEDRVRLDTKVSVDRAAAGVGWSKMGMIQGKAHLTASVTLVRI